MSNAGNGSSPGKGGASRSVAVQDMGQNEEAMADFDAVLRMQPGNSHALFRRGFLWKRKKKYDEAAQDFEDAKQAVRYYFITV